MEFIQANRLSSDYINSLPIIRFDGRVVVVEDETEANRVLDSLMSEPFLGFDTESKPSFTKGTTYPVSLIQVSTVDTAYLFQLKKTGFSDSMIRFLENEDVKKIGVGLKNDLTKLVELRPFKPGGFIDLSKLALDKGIIQVGIRGLTARYLGFRLTKAAQKTNWAQTVLTMKQQLYAASDAWVCLKIYPRLIADATDYRKFNEDEQKTENNNMIFDKGNDN